MPKHNLRTVDYIEKVYAPKIEKEEVVEESEVVVRLRIDANYKVTGKFSGREYLFQGAGSVKNVDTKDVEWLLSLRQGKGCCGGGGGSALFELAGE